MIQVVAILMDSLRMLLAKRLFWLSIFMSALIGIMYLSIKLEPDGMSFLFGWKKVESAIICSGNPEGEWFYITLFSSYINRFWIGSGAILLALISTVSVFPEFTRAGTIEVSLSKPVSRMKLFFVKYLGCMMFVALQSLLLAVLVFVAIGLRLDYWNWSIFWLVPVLSFAFSLIHCVQVLVGVVTKSSLVSLLVGVSFWVMVWVLQVTEQTMYLNSYAMVEEKMKVDWKSADVISLDEKQAADLDTQGYYTLVKSVSAPFPKVRDVTLSLEQLVRFRDSGSILEQIDLVKSVEENDVQYKSKRAERRTRERHSTQYIYLTSLGFECVVLSLACFIFVRRDY